MVTPLPLASFVFSALFRGLLDLERDSETWDFDLDRFDLCVGDRDRVLDADDLRLRDLERLSEVLFPGVLDRDLELDLRDILLRLSCDLDRVRDLCETRLLGGDLDLDLAGLRDGGDLERLLGGDPRLGLLGGEPRLLLLGGEPLLPGGDDLHLSRGS